MSLNNFFQELKDHMKGSIIRTTSKGRTRRGAEERCRQMWDISSEISVPSSPCSSSSSSSSSQLLHQQGRSGWANLPPELLLNIVARVESTCRSWPSRRDLVACASVCRSWRQATKEVTWTPEQCGCLTFPSSLKQASAFLTLFQKA